MFDKAALELAAQDASLPYQREHVTPYFYENPGRFRLLTVTNSVDFSRYRWTVDTKEDLNFVRQVYARFNGIEFGWLDLLAQLEREPELCDINRRVSQKPLKDEVAP